MSIGWRFLLFEDGGTIRRIPQRKVDRLLTGRISLPEYAGKTLRSAFVILELRNSKPAMVAYVEGSKRHFDHKGFIRSRPADAHLRSISLSSRDLSPSINGNVIYIEKLLARKRRDEMYCWDPTPADITRMIEFIWGPRARLGMP